MSHIYLGIDGFDTPYAGCTTHFTVFLLKKILSTVPSVEVEKNPFLVRLNPAIPWRTRGNASISILLTVGDSGGFERIVSVSREVAAKYAEATGGNKGTIIITEHSEELEQLSIQVYERALVDVVPREHILRKLESIGKIHLIGKDSVVGALSAIGFQRKDGQRSYELIAYREPGRIGKRKVSQESVLEAERIYTTLFNNYDYVRKKSVASPAGPDPILIGLRGLDPVDLVKAFEMIEVREPVWAKCLFITNQHTDAHMVPRTIGSLRVYQAGFVEGVVEKEPVIKKRGHTELVLTDSTGHLKILFFAETRPMNKVAQKLRIGDYVRVLGSIVPSKDDTGIVMEADKLWVLQTVPHVTALNPRCPVCGSRMKSLGSGGGYKCPKCGYKTREALEKELVMTKRGIVEGPYTPADGRIRHLVRPGYLEGKIASRKLPLLSESCTLPGNA